MQEMIMEECKKHQGIAILGCSLCKLEQWQQKCLALKKENQRLKKALGCKNLKKLN